MSWVQLPLPSIWLKCFFCRDILFSFIKKSGFCRDLIFSFINICLYSDFYEKSEYKHVYKRALGGCLGKTIKDVPCNEKLRGGVILFGGPSDP